jgi:hypothetical protein
MGSCRGRGSPVLRGFGGSGDRRFGLLLRMPGTLWARSPFRVGRISAVPGHGAEALRADRVSARFGATARRRARDRLSAPSGRAVLRAGRAAAAGPEGVSP